MQTFVKAWLSSLGAYVVSISSGIGSFVLFFNRAFKTAYTRAPSMHKILVQMECIGLESFNIIFLTGTFAGMVFALQTYIGFQRVGGEQFIGSVIALGMIRELGPVLTGLMVTGRAGSAIAAEIGTMKITEQIDALSTLGIDPYSYLIVPRIIAGTIVMPFLTLFAMACGIVGGYIVCVNVLMLSPHDYVTTIAMHVELSDIMGGIFKAGVFGLILSWVGAFKGFKTHGGAKGVGIATTQAVVTGSIMILMSNYFLTKLLERL